MSQINDQKLMDYLNGKLSPQEQHEVEEWMLDNPFNAEALEGLQQPGAAANAKGNVDQINRQLRTHLQKKRNMRRSRQQSSNAWTYLAVFVVLLLIVLTYLVVRLT